MFLSVRDVSSDTAGEEQPSCSVHLHFTFTWPELAVKLECFKLKC